jgi:hypothetical protein
VRLGEVNIGASGTRRADFTGLRGIWPLTAGFGLANARPWRQSWPEEPVIRRMSDKSVVKMTFAKGASLEDPSGLFNSSLEGNTRRAIDIHEGDKIDERR